MANSIPEIDPKLMPMLQNALRLEQSGQTREAAETLKSSILEAEITQTPVPRGALGLLARLFYKLNQWQELEDICRKSLKQFPRDLDFWNMLGIALRRQGQFEAASDALLTARKVAPRDIAPLINLGNLYLDMKRGSEAIDAYRLLVRAQPKRAEFQRLLGNAYVMVGELKRAATQFDTALRLDPDDILAWIDRIKVETDFEHHNEAFAIVSKALDRHPTNHRLIEARIMVLRRGGRFKEAEALLEARVNEAPDDPWAHFQLAETIARFDRTRGNTHYKRAVELQPQNGIYWINYANSLDRTRQGSEADNIQAGYEAVLKAMETGPLPSRFTRMARNILVRMGRFDLVSKLGSFKDLGRTWASESLHDALHYHLARVETPEDRYEILEQHRIWGRIEDAKAKLNPVSRPALIERRSKIRLGIMSSDLRNHPVSYFAMPLFDFLDRNKFEVYCYSWSRHEPDPVQHYLASCVDEFRWHKAIADRDAAQLIASDKLDMLFELGSSTDMNKLEVMAYKPAPLQASWLGYPHSAGLETIDYILCDPFINPPDPKLLIEKPFLMPKSWVAMGRLGFNEREEINPVIASERNKFITFGTANNPYKYSPKVLETWAKIVASVPQSKFMFVRPEAGAKGFRDSMAEAFSHHGVARERIIFVSVRGQHMRWYNEMDISLDTFPQTGGTTTCESLFMGVPVVSLVGPAFFERLSYSNLSNAGLGDLATFTIEDYIATAQKLAADVKKRHDLKSSLRYQIKSTPLGQPDVFARDFYGLVQKTVRERR